MYFETMKEFYDDDIDICPLDSEDIIIIEKGRAIYDVLVQNRKELEEQRKIREISALDKNSQNFNQDEERKKT